MCPKCGKDDTKVVDMRHAENAIQRRRRCMNCLAMFLTRETVVSMWEPRKPGPVRKPPTVPRPARPPKEVVSKPMVKPKNVQAEKPHYSTINLAALGVWR
jgi:hypothetical protein